MADQHTPVRPVNVGDPVRVIDENYAPRVALVTCVHGEFGKEYDTPEGGKRTYVPCLNVLLVSTDETKVDPYGRQSERLSSLQHYVQGPDGMPKPGRYWENL